MSSLAARAIAVRDNAGIPLSLIRIDGGTQSRAMLSDAVIEDYAAKIQEGVEFPPVVIFHDGAEHWLADGFHRVRAFIAASVDHISADVRQGTRRDAVLYSVGANGTHGLPRTNDDKRRAVMTLLNDAEWSKWSDREIARQCNVSHQMVAPLRASLTGRATSDRTYTTKHGTIATMNTSAIGRSHDEQEEAMEQPAEAEAVVKKYRGATMFVPEGVDITDLCRRGIAMEADGEAPDRIAGELGLNAQAYRIARQIVLLADHVGLSERDKKTAQEALNLLVTAGQWGRAWEIAEPLAKKVWGEGRKDGLLFIADKRLEQFERSFGIVMQSCLTTEEIDLPYISADRAKKAFDEIRAARSALLRFAERIKEIHG
jgi:hypothetical protein